MRVERADSNGGVKIAAEGTPESPAGRATEAANDVLFFRYHFGPK
jgi:hypothetical protein